VIYWDTSCVLKLYTAESDSLKWQRTILATPLESVSSALLETELGIAFEQKELRGELIPGSARKLWTMFQKDLKDGQFRLFPVGSDVLKQAVEIASHCIRAKPAIPLRTLDAIHLSTAMLLKCSHMATTDQRMLSGARRIGIPISDKD
jgi:predicted nucleic acid-binding protein